MLDANGVMLELHDEVRRGRMRDRLFVLGFEPERDMVELVGARVHGSCPVAEVRKVRKGGKPSWFR